jgi:hypothetical protein
MGIIAGVLLFFVLAQFIDGRVAFALGLVAAVAVSVVLKRRAVRRTLRQMGLTPEEAALVKQDQERADHNGAVQRIAAIQTQRRDEILEATGVDVTSITPEIGREISWADIVRHVFRVCDFDRAGTAVGPDNEVHPSSPSTPYGYLLVESPILNQRVRIPIIHRDDFLLATFVFDEPNAADRMVQEDLLVTYAPKRLRRDGRTDSPHHVLHYVIAPRGTLERYYAVDNDVHMAKPQPEKLFGQFIYEGEISVQLNQDPKL